MSYKKILPVSFKNFIKNKISENIHPEGLFYSQSGEDAILYSFFKHKIINDNYKGFYVDIGANAPVKGSNSFFFYYRGWNGVAVDVIESITEHFKAVRPNDICVTQAISDKEEELDFYYFDESNSWGNTLDKKSLDENINADNYKTTKVKTITLNKLLEKYLPEDKEIDFLDIDVEGYEYKILKAFDFVKYKPKFILVEMDGLLVIDCFKDSLYELLTSKNYLFIARTNLGGNLGTSVFMHEGFLAQ